MAEVRRQDILCRIGSRTQARHGVLAWSGSSRRVEEFKEAFTRADASTCATYWTRDGVLKTAAANALRADDWGPYYEQGGLVDSAGNPLHGIRLEGTRTNVVLWNRDLTNAAWEKTGGGGVTAVKDQTGIDGVASSASRITASGANGTCLQAITLGSSQRLQSCYIKRLVGTGNIDMTTDNGSTWTTLTVTAAWTRVKIPAQTLANPTVGWRIVTSADSVAIDYAQNETGAFESSPIATTTAAVTRAADSLTVPFNFGPFDTTVVSRIARPVWADSVGSIVTFPGLFDVGNNVAPFWRGYCLDSARTVVGELSSGSLPSATRSLPAGAAQTYAFQFKDMVTGPRVAVDVGAGYSSFSGAATQPMAAFGSQTLRLGNVSGAGTNQLFGVLLDLMVLRGLFTYAEVVAVP